MNTRTAFLLALLLAACGGGPVGGDTIPPSDTPPAFTLDGTAWMMVGGSLDGAGMTPISGRAPTLIVDGGQVRGSTGCNTYSGKISVSDDGAIRWGGFAWTEMGCEPDVMEVESRFLSALTRTDRAQLDGDSMTLTDGDRSVVLEMVVKVAQPQVPLEGTRWLLTGFAVGETARSVLAGTNPTLFVDLEAGAIRGNGGCNDFGARVDLSGNRMSVSEMFYTEIACEEPIMAQEAEYFEALVTATGWTIDGANLSIETSDGWALTFVEA